MNRRQFLAGTLFGAAAVGVIPATSHLLRSGSMLSPANAAEGTFEISLSEKEWRARLTDAQFNVLRNEATEKPFSSPLLKEARKGNYHCAGCDLPAYASKTKFDSKTGWPSFYDALPNAVRTKEDNSFFSTRTEVHCRRCGGHFGHIFNDGPKPTGLRHCLNGLALTFEPSSQA